MHFNIKCRVSSCSACTYLITQKYATMHIFSCLFLKFCLKIVAYVIVNVAFMLHLQVIYFSKLLQVLLVVIKQPSADLEYVIICVAIILHFLMHHAGLYGIVIYIVQIQYCSLMMKKGPWAVHLTLDSNSGWADI